MTMNNFSEYLLYGFGILCVAAVFIILISRFLTWLAVGRFIINLERDKKYFTNAPDGESLRVELIYLFKLARRDLFRQFPFDSTSLDIWKRASSLSKQYAEARQKAIDQIARGILKNVYENIIKDEEKNDGQ